MKKAPDLTTKNESLAKQTEIIQTPPVVGIGASAGGLAALRIFLKEIPKDSGLAYVIVMHLSPDHDSHLAQLLQQYSAIPVHQIESEVPLEANHVYVIPPGKNLVSVDSHLRLLNLEKKRRDRAPVDHFFRTLAATHDGLSAAVILTGTGSDGTLGIQEVKANGGLTVVQDPAEAEFDGMPQSAISTGVIDLILTLKEMLTPIRRFLLTKPRIESSEDENRSDDVQRILHNILKRIRTQENSDYTRYKQSTILRRIRRRMQLANIDELEAYHDFLVEHPEEVAALANDFLITVTSFFRDKEVFSELGEKIIPELFKGKGDGEQIRVWSVGCATGEEAYSLAILLLEEAERIKSSVQIQVFASDLHPHSLKKARDGLYPGDIEIDVTSDRLARFFQKENGSYRIKSEVRDLVVFSPHNLLADPPFSRVDLLVCRNVLIYLQRNLQPDILGLFHYALKSKGYLVLGTAESVNQPELFSTESKVNGIYVKRNIPFPERHLPVLPFTRIPSLNGISPTQHAANVPSFGSLHHRMVEHFAPPSLLVNADHEVVHLSHRVSRYLKHPGGVPTTNVFKLVHEGLQTELRSLLLVAASSKTTCLSRPVNLQLDGLQRELILRASPGNEEDGETFILVIFDERAISDDVSEVANVGSDVVSRELHIELELNKHRLQKAIEEYESSQEEMRASNEELQSANEELRSTLEELETSKEELQSINEELQTANQENRHKVAELNQLSDDLQQLVTATHIATLFLDRELRIMRFTPQIGELFNLRAADHGRPLSDLTHRLSYGDLIKDANSVIEHLTPIEREISDTDNRWYLARIRPYRTAKDTISGLVLTFIDITERKNSELALRQSEERYRTLFESIDEGFCIFKVEEESPDKLDFRFLDANSAFFKLTGLSGVKHQKLQDIAPKQTFFWHDVYQRALDQSLSVRFEGGLETFDRWLEVYAFQLSNMDQKHFGVLLKDIHSRKLNEETLTNMRHRDSFRVALADALRVVPSSELIQQTACRMLGEYLLVETVVYEEFDADYTVVTSQEYVKEDVEISHRFRPWVNNVDLQTQITDGKDIIAIDTFESNTLTPQQKAECRSLGLRSYLVVPLLSEGRLCATFSLFESKPRSWAASDIELIREVAERTTDELIRVRAETSSRAREVELNSMNERKNEFLAMLSHELRNPLAPILNSLHLLENADDRNVATTAQSIIKRQATLMSRLIDDLLDVTRIARGKLRLTNDHVELSQLAERTTQDYSSVFSEKNITIEFDSSGKDIWINGDAHRLSQTIGNILHNSAKFTPEGGKTSISVMQKADRARIIIKDSGIGMSEEILEQLFQPFVQGVNSFDRRLGGLGLGLALSKQLVELHNGILTAHSDGANKGSTFEIILPLTKTYKQEILKKSTTTPPRSRKILIIEDNQDSATSLCEILKLEGHKVVVATDGPSGITLAREFKPEFIFCDLGLPEMDGFEVASLLEKFPDRLAMTLVALSGYAMPDDLERSNKAGFDLHLAKPAKIEHILEILAQEIEDSLQE